MHLSSDILAVISLSRTFVAVGDDGSRLDFSVKMRCLENSRTLIDYWSERFSVEWNLKARFFAILHQLDKIVCLLLTSQFVE